MRKAGIKAGFTLIELLLGIMATAILVLAIGSSLVMIAKGWRNYTAGVNMQRDAMIALRVIEREIRNSNIDEISGDSDSIDFSVNGTRTNAYVYNASDIVSNPDVELVAGSWNPVKGSNYVAIAFTLKTSGGVFQKDYAATIYPRNAP